MKLSVYGSFEPALLNRALSHWNERVPLFSTVAVYGPSLLGWGLRSEVAEGELRILALDRAGLLLATAEGVPMALQPGAKGPVPLVVLCPGADGAPDASLLAGVRGEQVECLFAAGVDQLLDPESERAGGVPYTDAFYLALATVIFRRAHARLRPEVKVIAVDCDGTLWQGLCAEDGPEGVSVGSEELALHAMLLAQKRTGRVLVLVSKNVPADVEAVFERRGDLGLSLADVVAVRAGWDPKAVVLQRLSRELGLGLDTFLFIDDSPAECALVAAALPEVAVLRRPPDGVRSLLEAAWPLDLRADLPGALGAARTSLYQGEEKRRAAMQTAPSFSEYVDSLDVRVSLAQATENDEGRVFELTQRTNQFNTRADRPSAETVRQAIGAGRVLVARVADRFGDYGLCGVVFLAAFAETLVVERLLLSCRVLGRGVEEEIFDGLVARARAQGLAALEIALTGTQRNLPARNFVERVAADFRSRAREEGGGYRFVLQGLGRCLRQLDRAVDDPPEERVSDWRAPDWNAVAELTRDPAALGVLLGLAPESKAGGESVLAVVAEVLGRPVSRSDNLYALGADSLRMVRILARLRSKLGVEVPIAELLYRGDVEDLIALAERGARQPEDDPAFLAQLGSLYDEEEPAA
jgi:FkbH-like protein